MRNNRSSVIGGLIWRAPKRPNITDHKPYRHT